MAVNIHITIIELNALHTKRQNLFQELDAVIHLLMEAKHWGLRKSRNATCLNSRFKSLDTLKVKIIFFFSSRRRHTRSLCDWSSDVCSSDLNQAGFNWNPPSQFKGPNYYVRVDHTFGPNDSVFVRWLQNTFDTKQGDFLNARPQVYPGFPPLGEVNRLGKNLAISYRHNFSPTLVNEFTAGFNRFAFQFTFGESNPNFPNPQKVPIWADDCVLGSTLNVDGPYCLSPHTQRAITTPQLVDNITWVHGAHTLRAGINFRFYIHNDSRGFFGSSVVTPIIRFNRSNRLAGFNNIPAAGNAATCPTCANSTDINRLQQAIDELAGIPSRIQQAFLANFASNTYGSTNFATVYTRAHQYDSYVQDEWKLRPNLTLNF